MSWEKKSNHLNVSDYFFLKIYFFEDLPKQCLREVTHTGFSARKILQRFNSNLAEDNSVQGPGNSEWLVPTLVLQGHQLYPKVLARVGNWCQALEIRVSHRQGL